MSRRIEYVLILIDGDRLLGIEPIHIPIDYCPMCGRPLKEARNG